MSAVLPWKVQLVQLADPPNAKDPAPCSAALNANVRFLAEIWQFCEDTAPPRLAMAGGDETVLFSNAEFSRMRELPTIAEEHAMAPPPDTLPLATEAWR